MRLRKAVLSLAVAAGVLSGSPWCYADEDYGTGKETPAQRDARMKWWREARFGLFVHWNVSCVPGGNYLLNVGPNPEGEIPAPAVKRLRQVGSWTKVNGEAIFGTSASPFKKQLPWGRCTKKVDDAGATLYFHVFQWPADGKLVVPGLKNRVEMAYLLADPGKKPLQTATDAAGVTVNVPAAAPDKDILVVVVRVMGKVDIAD